MIALLQRVTFARVEAAGEVIGEIGPGLLVLVAVEPTDTEAQADRLIERVLGYRVFDDGDGRMNLSVSDTGGGLLLVPQFTLAADTARGMRPGFTGAAGPELGRSLYEHALSRARASRGRRGAPRRFGAHMQVSLTNDGPVTFWLRASAAAASA
jgi:D-tyrosyl-tRNA(Tyr) deacylase